MISLQTIDFLESLALSVLTSRWIHKINLWWNSNIGTILWTINAEFVSIGIFCMLHSTHKLIHYYTILAFISQIHKGDPGTFLILIPSRGSNWGSSGFSRNQSNCGLSGAYATCIYCGMSMKINMCKTPNGAWRSWTRTCFAFVFECVVGKNPEDP